MIENVGNLVCPALFDLGERGKVVIVSVTEGEDKPLKYPHMFRASDVMLLNKIDLLPHVSLRRRPLHRVGAPSQPAACDVSALGDARRRPHGLVCVASLAGPREGMTTLLSIAPVGTL